MELTENTKRKALSVAKRFDAELNKYENNVEEPPVDEDELAYAEAIVELLKGEDYCRGTIGGTLVEMGISHNTIIHACKEL